jgi:hypothetical protein
VTVIVKPAPALLAVVVVVVRALAVVAVLADLLVVVVVVAVQAELLVALRRPRQLVPVLPAKSPSIPQALAAKIKVHTNIITRRNQMQLLGFRSKRLFYIFRLNFAQVLNKENNGK